MPPVSKPAAPSSQRPVASPASKVVTVSDSTSGGTRPDRSGPALADALGAAGFTVVDRRVVPDGIGPVADVLRQLAAGFHGLVITTGGTGFAPTDLTPEATRSVIDREAPGIAEAMRAASPLGRLTRGVAGMAGRCLICNVPGSPAGAVESLAAVIDILPHALRLLGGDDPLGHEVPPTRP